MFNYFGVKEGTVEDIQKIHRHRSTVYAGYHFYVTRKPS